MRIAVSADNARGLQSPVSAHFGRCPYYVLVQVLDRDIAAAVAIENPFYGQHQPGQVPAMIRQHRVDVMLAGGMGGRAVAFFPAVRHRAGEWCNGQRATGRRGLSRRGAAGRSPLRREHRARTRRAAHRLSRGCVWRPNGVTPPPPPWPHTAPMLYSPPATTCTKEHP